MNTIRPMNTIYTSNVDPHKSSLSALHALKTILFNLFLLLKWLKTTGHLSELHPVSYTHLTLPTIYSV